MQKLLELESANYTCTLCTILSILRTWDMILPLKRPSCALLRLIRDFTSQQQQQLIDCVYHILEVQHDLGDSGSYDLTVQQVPPA